MYQIFCSGACLFIHPKGLISCLIGMTWFLIKFIRYILKWMFLLWLVQRQMHLVSLSEYVDDLAQVFMETQGCRKKILFYFTGGGEVISRCHDVTSCCHGIFKLRDSELLWWHSKSGDIKVISTQQLVILLRCLVISPRWLNISLRWLDISLRWDKINCLVQLQGCSNSSA